MFQLIDQPDIVIEPASARTADAWARMRAELWPDSEPQELAGEVEAYLGGDHSSAEIAFIACDSNGTPIGFAEYTLRAYAEGCESTPVAYLEAWFVAATARHQGIGRALIAAGEAWARSRGVTELASDAEIDNTSSAAAHLASGFEDVGVIRCFRKVLD